MHYEIARYVKHSFHVTFTLLFITFSHFIQTLTELNLDQNKISATGAQYLTGALGKDRVRRQSDCIILLLTKFHLCFVQVSC
jgi:hypothetical protein